MSLVTALAVSSCTRVPSVTAPSPTAELGLTGVIGTSRTPSQASVIRVPDLTGTWTGSYTIPRCQPTNSPNSCTTYAKPGSMTVILTQQGSSLSGTFRSDLLGTVDISGSVDATGGMTLYGQRLGSINCFSLGPLLLDVVTRVGPWSTPLQRNGTFAGSFSQFAYQTLSSCYKTFFEYNTEVSELRRDAVVKRVVP